VRGDADERAWSEIRERLGYPVPDPEAPPGTSRLVASRGGTPLARLALGVTVDLVGAPGRTGWIGWYEALEAQPGVALLGAARETLRAERVARVLGPFHGSTWDRYRLAVRAPGAEEDSPFLSEPWNPPGYFEHLTAAGFAPVAEYESRLVPARADHAERAAAAESALEARGVRVRRFDPDRFDDELERLYRLSLDAFAGNPYYSPIPWARFRSMYRALGPLIDPALVLLAESDASELLGFCFSFGDPLAPAGAPRIILKTLAVAPTARGLGLGGALTTLTQGVATERGVPVIHALMAAGNLSRRISSGLGGEPFRRYTLFGADEP
jgi:GNAT superfamily N-acetyltransferase